MILMKQRNQLVILVGEGMSNVKVGYKNKKVFNDLNRLMTDITNNKVKKEDAIKRLEKYIRLKSTKIRKKYCFSK